jgi:hypothetical protein
MPEEKYMSSSDDATQTTDALEYVPQLSETRNVLRERRQSVRPQKQTDILPHLANAAPNARMAWRQVTQLREENRHLRFELENQRAELQGLLSEHQTLQAKYENDLSTATLEGQREEVEHYQGRLQEMIEERNRLQEAHQELERRYQELYHQFQDAVEEEAQKMVTEAARTLELSPDSTPSLLQDAMRTLELKARQVEDKHLIEVLYLKREIQRMAGRLAHERKLLDEEHQSLLALQNSIREQAELRYKTLEARFHARRRMTVVTAILLGPALLVAFQFLCLVLFQVHIAATISLALIAPIVVFFAAAVVFASPISMIKYIYTAAPHKKRVE